MKKSGLKIIILKMRISYVVILMIPLIAMAAIYHASVGVMSTTSKDYWSVMLQQIRNMTDTRLRELESISYYTNTNGDIVDLITMDSIKLGSPENYNVYKACNSVPNFSLVNSIVERVDIVLKNSSYILSPGSATRYNRLNHSFYFGYTGMDYESAWKYLFDKNHHSEYVTFKHDGKIGVSYVNSVFFGNASDPLAVLVIKINPNFFYDVLMSLDPEDERQVFITDRDNHPIFSYGGQDGRNNLDTILTHVGENGTGFYNGYMISMVESNYNGWKYYSVSPEKVIMSNVSYIKNFFWILGALSFALGGYLVFLLTRNKATALIALASCLDRFSGGQAKQMTNEYDYIAESVNSLVASNASLSSLAQRQQPLLEAAMLRKLLFSPMDRKVELPEVFGDKADMLLRSSFIVVIVDLNLPKAPLAYSADGLNLVTAAVKESIVLHLSKQVFILDMDGCSLVLVIPGEQEGDEFAAAVDTALDSVYRSIASGFQMELRFYISDPFQDVLAVSEAYKQAAFILERAVHQKQIHQFHRCDLPTVELLYVYPIEKELKLIQLVKYGDEAQLRGLLQEIQQDNERDGGLSVAMTKQLTFAIRSTIIRGLRNTGFSDAISQLVRQLDNCESIEEISNAAVAIHLEIQRSMSACKAGNTEDLKAQIISYIHQNYADCNLGISNLSAKFNMSESSLYQFFRERIGSSFADLLENVRIQRACELLSTKATTVKDVAAMVGYANDHSFRRAFKRVLGINPGKYEGAGAEAIGTRQ